jgi:hypothetical protein
VPAATVQKPEIFSSRLCGEKLTLRIRPGATEGLQVSYNYFESKPQSGLPLLAIFGIRGEIQIVGGVRKAMVCNLSIAE